MSSAPSPVENVQLLNSQLQWTYINNNTFAQVPAREILFTLPPTAPAHAYTICCLREDVESSPPFELLVLSATSVPPSLLEQTPVLNRTPTHLDASHAEVDVLVSTNSGLGHALSFWEDVLRPLLHITCPTAHQYGVVVTQDANSVKQYAQTLRSGKTIILISGDGGIVDLLNGGAEPSSPPLIALLPLGTGNALFHSLHKPVSSGADLATALRTLLLGYPADLPVFRADFSPASLTSDGQPVQSLYGAIVASYAFHASIIYESDTPEYRVHGARRFGMVAQNLLRESHQYKATVDVRRGQDTFERVGHSTHGYVLVSMVSNLEKTFTISPAARPLDGKLYLVHFGPVGEQKTMEAMTKAYDGGKHVELQWDDVGEHVRYDEVQGVRIATSEDHPRWRKFCVDGTIVHAPEGGAMVVSAAADAVKFRILVDRSVAP